MVVGLPSFEFDARVDAIECRVIRLESQVTRKDGDDKPANGKDLTALFSRVAWIEQRLNLRKFGSKS